MENKKEFEERLTIAENAGWTQANATIEVAYQLAFLNDLLIQQAEDKTKPKPQPNPYAMEGTGVELDGPARL